MPTAMIGDATIHYTEAGAGKPVLLLLHAFPLNAAMWAPQMGVFSGSHRTIAMDARGFGGSGPVPERLDMSMIADDAAALLGKLGVEKAVVCGLSMGGYAAFELWRRHRARVQGLILADTRAGDDDEAGRKNREAFARNAITMGITWVSEQLAPKLQRSPPDEQADKHIRQLIERGAPAAVAAAQRGMAARRDSTDLLAGIDVPTLVLVGAQDALTPPAKSKEMAAAIPGARLEVLDGAGHISNVERPGTFNQAVLDWMRSRFGAS